MSNWYYFSKWAFKISKPRESLGRFFFYIFLCLGFAVLYSGIFIFVILVVFPLSKK